MYVRLSSIALSVSLLPYSHDSLTHYSHRLSSTTLVLSILTSKTRMQLRRQAATTVDQAVLKVRHSLMEPALRLRNSLSEPSPSATVMHKTTPMTAATGTASLHEPGLRLSLRPAQSVVVAAASASGYSTVVIKPIKSSVHQTQQQPHGATVTASLGPMGTARRIIQREGFFALYKGLTAVYTGIVPKMAIRFVSFEQYQNMFTKLFGLPQPSTQITFTAGLLSGLTEAILVVTPAEVCKIRMQSQYHSLMDASQMAHRKYTNVLQTAITISREEGILALYKGVVPTMLRQGCNQAVNFTGYNLIKQKVLEHQGSSKLEHWQSLLIGGISGGMGPTVNNPLDVVKTRLQKQVVLPGKMPKYTGLWQACVVIAREEGVLALWKGITPRLLRIMPGQAITFMTYEAVTSRMNKYGYFQ
jgi:solute carrier family 25 (mitochondrial citrate transporter), member 1